LAVHHASNHGAALALLERVDKAWPDADETARSINPLLRPLNPISDAVPACHNRIRPASILGKGDPKSGQITPALNRQHHLKSCHSRIYAIRRKWHAAWLFNFDIPAR
jgi:hypothetical protein